jgi:hypothetical protein
MQFGTPFTLDHRLAQYHGMEVGVEEHSTAKSVACYTEELGPVEGKVDVNLKLDRTSIDKPIVTRRVINWPEYSLVLTVIQLIIVVQGQSCPVNPKIMTIGVPAIYEIYTEPARDEKARDETLSSFLKHLD